MMAQILRLQLPPAAGGGPAGGCVYPIDDANGQHDCGALRQARSSYCLHHHEICYVPIGSPTEAGLLRRFETLAGHVGKGRTTPFIVSGGFT
jgi:hypothetical protein